MSKIDIGSPEAQALSEALQSATERGIAAGQMMDRQRRMHASGMAHLLARISSRIKDSDDRECVRRALADYCALNDCDLVPCSGGGFAVEPRLA